MGFVTVPFSPSSRPELKEIGLNITAFKVPLMLMEESWFEAPLFIDSDIQTGNFLQVGAFCSISGGLLGHCQVGRYCAFAPEVVIGANEHPTDWLTVSRVSHVFGLHGWEALLKGGEVDRAQSNVMPYPKSTRITRIGNDVWIGQRGLIRSGVSIGDGAIIAAGTVVTKDVPPYAVVAGVPGKVIKMRFPEKLVERLLKVQWWQYSLYDFDRLPYDKIEAALDALEAQVADKGLKPYAPEKFTASGLAARFAAAATPP